VLDVGGVKVKVESPNVFVTAPHEPKVGVALPTLIVIVVVPPEIWFVASAGVKVPVMIELPYPATVAVLPLSEITDDVPEEYVQVPGVLDVGAVSMKVESPYVLLTPAQVNVGVAFATVTVIVVVPPEM
jgi:hypothetical protein